MSTTRAVPNQTEVLPNTMSESSTKKFFIATDGYHGRGVASWLWMVILLFPIVLIFGDSIVEGVGYLFSEPTATAVALATPVTSHPITKPIFSPTSTPTNTATSTPTATNTATPTNTPTATNTLTPSPTNTATATHTPTNTPTLTLTPTSTNTPTTIPSLTPTSTRQDIAVGSGFRGDFNVFISAPQDGIPPIYVGYMIVGLGLLVIVGYVVSPFMAAFAATLFPRENWVLVSPSGYVSDRRPTHRPQRETKKDNSPRPRLAVAPPVEEPPTTFPPTENHAPVPVAELPVTGLALPDHLRVTQIPVAQLAKLEITAVAQLGHSPTPVTELPEEVTAALELWLNQLNGLSELQPGFNRTHFTATAVTDNGEGIVTHIYLPIPFGRDELPDEVQIEHMWRRYIQEGETQGSVSKEVYGAAKGNGLFKTHVQPFLNAKVGERFGMAKTKRRITPPASSSL